MEGKNPKTGLLPGTLDMLVLKALAGGPRHGHAIARLIQRCSEDVLRVEEGSLYPALQRLEMNGWIEGDWGVSENRRRARFYRLTPEGGDQLHNETERYRLVTGAIARVMGAA